MDPISQGALGAALPQSVKNQAEFRHKAVTITWVGWLSGMAPDIDVFIRSSVDPLLFLEFHRQFTHSLFFIPIGALICALLFSRFSRPNLDFKQTYIVCLLGYSTHALLDACTSYGTQLLWPFTNYRFAWNNIAVVDPFATLPLLACVLIAATQRKVLFARIGLLWFLFYLAMGFVQQHRALDAAKLVAAQRGHDEALISIKAGFANILLWKSIYVVDDTYYVDAIRVGLSSMVYSGTSVKKLNVERDLPWLDPTSQQGIDLERFRWFSKDYLAMDPIRANFVIDMRYSMLPNEVNSLWGIGLTPSATTDAHVTFESDRDTSVARRAIFWAMLKGQTCIPQASRRDSQKKLCARVMTYRDYNSRTDVKAVRQIWLECGWIDDLETEGSIVSEFFESAEDALVATIDDQAECSVISNNGTMRYQQEDLSLGAVTGVTTSRIARKLGFARELTALMLARQVAAGHEISALGMFEQGFYDKLGFGTGCYEQLIKFDPSTLNIEREFRPPKRLTAKDSEAIYIAMTERQKSHGAVNILSKGLLKADLKAIENGFGLGYFDGPGNTLSHFVWGSSKGEHGPFEIAYRAYQSSDQLMELLALLKSLGDQINLVETLEFGDIQLQDLLKQPFRNRRNTENSRFANRSISMAYWQARILDLHACLDKTHLDTPPVKFNLALTDPVTLSLPETSNWQGIGGDYVVSLGDNCHADIGRDPALPTLEASVNAFTRAWLGVRPASQLAATTDLSADSGLLAKLDRSFSVPRPHLGWDF